MSQSKIKFWSSNNCLHFSKVCCSLHASLGPLIKSEPQVLSLSPFGFWYFGALFTLHSRNLSLSDPFYGSGRSILWIWKRIRKTSFSLQLKNEHSKLERYIKLGWKGLTPTPTSAYWNHSQVTKNMKCCEYGPRIFVTSKPLQFSVM